MVFRVKKAVVLFSFVLSFCAFLLVSCSSGGKKKNASADGNLRSELFELLKNENLSEQTRFAIVNNIVQDMLLQKDYTHIILFLTEWVEDHPQDLYNAYWLMVTANTYLEMDAKPIAEYYFERIINNYNDLLVNSKDGKELSVHFMSLQHLIQISKTPVNRISYFNQLITRFPDKVSITEMYARLALEYEKEGEWNLAMRAFTQFLAQEDASTIRIPDIPNAYANARRLIDFNNSTKSWTFETLDELVAAVKKAITAYNPTLLDSYKSRVNFFNVSWRQDENSSNAQDDFYIRNFMRGNRIRFSEKLDESSSPTEAYLRTWGWSTINVWYFYFRKVNFPVDPEIHGRWEWAGIYYGEKL